MKDLYIDMVKIKSKRDKIKMSDRILDLNISQGFLYKLNKKKEENKNNILF